MPRSATSYRNSPALEGHHRIQIEADETLLPAMMHAGWTQINRAQHGTMEAHTHGSAYEFCYIVQGVISWWVNDQVFEVEPNQIFMTHPNEAHGGVDEVLHPCEIYWIQLDLNQHAGLGLTRKDVQAIHREFKRLESRVSPGTPVILDHFQRIIEEHRFPDSFSTESTRALCQTLLYDLVRAYRNGDKDPAKHRRQFSRPIQNAIHCLADSVGGPPALSDAAEAAGLRPTQFRVRFKTETGFSPQGYFNRLRLREAQRRLKERSDSITEIAHDLGFNSSQHFAGTFKKETGLTPGGYRHRSTAPNRSD